MDKWLETEQKNPTYTWMTDMLKHGSDWIQPLTLGSFLAPERVLENLGLYPFNVANTERWSRLTLLVSKYVLTYTTESSPVSNEASTFVEGKFETAKDTVQHRAVLTLTLHDTTEHTFEHVHASKTETGRQVLEQAWKFLVQHKSYFRKCFIRVPDTLKTAQYKDAPLGIYYCLIRKLLSEYTLGIGYPAIACSSTEDVDSDRCWILRLWFPHPNELNLIHTDKIVSDRIVAKVMVRAKDRKTAIDMGQEALYKAAFLNIANAFQHIDLKWIKKHMGSMHIVLGPDTIPLENVTSVQT